MKHYSDARKDLFVRSLEDRFGHFGYAGWFKMLEVLHEHGRGDNLCITLPQLASELSSKPSSVRQLLAICQSAGKIVVEANGQQMKITVKNFNEKQRNKFRAGTVGADGGAASAQEEGDREGEGDRSIRKVVSSLVKRVFYRGQRWSDSELEDHRVQVPGKDFQRRVSDLEASRCQWYLDRIQMDSKTEAAMRHWVKVKAQESNR
jgi:hypothetical protein